MSPVSPLLLIFIATALGFDFLNGFRDSANIVSTVIASIAMGPRRILLLIAAAEFAAPFLFGVAVATTIGREVVQPHASTLAVMLAALLAASSWKLITWFLDIPSSSSHALVGGLIGAAVLGYGIDAVQIHLSHFEVPPWVITASAGAIALGTGTGGWRIIRTLGGKFYKIRPMHGFPAQVTSTVVILGWPYRRKHV